jgi:hypothetical protein
MSKRKALTAYELSCGYIQTHTDSKKRVTLHREHTVYHVRAFDSEGTRTAWDSYRTLTNARSKVIFLHLGTFLVQ